MNLNNLIKKANKNFEVIWHFNVSDLSMINAIFNSARRLNKPVILGVSEGERKFLGIPQIVYLIKFLREYYNFSIFLNADHCKSFETAKEAVDLGFDSVIFDGTRLSLKENIKITRQVVEYAKEKNKNILVEGELGYIGDSSKILYDLPEGVTLKKEYFTKPEEAEFFIKETGIDLFAPSVGNIHGIVIKKGKILNSKLNIKLIKEIKQKTGYPLVLHGGSGILKNEFIKAVEAGINIIHISTELRLIWKKELENFILSNRDEIVPYKILENPYKKVCKIVEKYLNLI